MAAAAPFPSPLPMPDDPSDHDHIELQVGPAGELSQSGNPKTRVFRATLTVRRPKVSQSATSRALYWLA